jgi:putative 2OG-Fe(II) oxygenase
MNSIVRGLLKKGVVKGESELLSNKEMKELENLILRSKDKHLKEGEVFQNVVGIDKRIDELLEKILSNPEIQKTLLELLGKNYLLRKIFARYNEPDDKGLMMHQDSLGEMSLMILVNDQLDGSTVFFQGSQLIPSEKHLAQKVSWNSLKLMNIAKYFLMPAIGYAGNYYYFLNRTWHGRKPGKSQKTKISLFFPCFPVAAKRKSFLLDNSKNSEFEWKSVTQPTLKKITSRQNYYSSVLKFENTSDKVFPLSMKANSFNQILKNKIYFTYTILKIIFLEILFFPIIIKRFLK